MIALYNYVKQHKSLKELSPAMAPGVSDTLWSMTDLAEMVRSEPAEAGSARPAQESRPA